MELFIEGYMDSANIAKKKSEKYKMHKYALILIGPLTTETLAVLSRFKLCGSLFSINNQLEQTL